MSQPPKPPEPLSPGAAHSDFSWPPTDEQLAYNFRTLERETACHDIDFYPVESSAAPAAPEGRSALPGSDEMCQLTSRQLEEDAARDRNAALSAGDEPQLSEFAFFGPPYAALDDSPGDEGSTSSNEDDLGRSDIESWTTADIAVTQHESTLDATSAGEWAVEIAQLQGLIERLTENWTFQRQRVDEA